MIWPTISLFQACCLILQRLAPHPRLHVSIHEYQGPNGPIPGIVSYPELSDIWNGEIIFNPEHFCMQRIHVLSTHHLKLITLLNQ
ncbi:hypothetical protein I7I50_04649 [Histoplasma capsulatum G186AR]|uniref:Uncharacterized protein n=1 Tax=Ajellomyces capsulatus TaxID=5037 RepID=A0A8H8CXC3_AJECA|nr:hypothetical protein I7I52_05558 [Histoplasma capsulatum]QSS75498.1 hypothetical protein I7I50_04649 [Histoplasma capsulatum G186AR]